MTRQVRMWVEYDGKAPYISIQPQGAILPYNDFGNYEHDMFVTADPGVGPKDSLLYEWQKKGEDGWYTVGTGDFIALTQSKEAGEVSGVYRCRVWNIWTWQETYSNEAEVKIELTCTGTWRSGPFGIDHAYGEMNPIYEVDWITFEFKGGTPPYDVKSGYTRKVAKYHQDAYMNFSIESFYDSELRDAPSGETEINHGKDWVNVILHNVPIWEDILWATDEGLNRKFNFYATSTDYDHNNFYTYHVIVTDAMGQQAEGELNCADGVYVYDSRYGEHDPNRPF